MKIFQLIPKDEFRDLTVDDRRCTAVEFDRLQGAIYFDGKPTEGKWEPPPLYSVYPRKPFPDVCLLQRGGLVVFPRAYDTLDMFLEMAGELIPLQFEGLSLTVCNITECVQCIDETKSEWQVFSTGNRLFLRPYFDVSQIPESTLFKIPQSPTSVYCWERHQDPTAEFKACYENNKFKGIGFRLVQDGG